MPRKDNSKNPLQIRLRAKSLPKISQRAYYSRLLDFITTERPLPRSWDIEIQWRNPNTQNGVTRNWRSDNFEDAIRESRSGFVSIVAMAISLRLRKL